MIPERFTWDDDPSNNKGWYDAEQIEKFLERIIGLCGHPIAGQACRNVVAECRKVLDAGKVSNDKTTGKHN